MGKKCIPGLICIENMTLFILFVVSVITIYVYYVYIVKYVFSGSIYLVFTSIKAA